MSVSEAFRSGLLDSLQEPVKKSKEVTQELSDPRNTGDYLQRVAMFAKLELLRRELEESLDACKKQAGKLGNELLEDMALAGVDRVSSHGLTIRPHKTFYVSKKSDADGATKQAICEALKNNGLEFLVINQDAYAPGTLKATIAEMRKEGKEIPVAVAKLLNIGETTKLTSQLSG